MTVAIQDPPIPDLTDPATFADAVPHDVFDRLRGRDGLYWQPARFGTANGGFWAVTRFADIIEIEKHPELFTSTHGVAFPMTNMPAESHLVDQLMLMDPPRHSAVRRAAAASFGPRVVAHFDSWIREIVVETLDRVVTLGEFDWITEVAAIIPSLVIARIIGVDPSERMTIVDWTNRSFQAQQKQGNTTHEQAAISAEMREYLSSTLKEAKRLDPQEDMATVLFQAAERGAVSESEALQFLTLLVGAGFETTHTTIGQSMRMMLEDPQVKADVDRAIPEIGADKVIGELLRMVTPAMDFARTALVDTELAGESIRQGDLMQMYFIAANRDPAMFVDPHRFNPWRTETTTLAFGSGPHRCMGNALAKLQLKIVFEEMDRHRIQLRLAGAPRRGRSVFINQLTSLPVAVV